MVDDLYDLTYKLREKIYCFLPAVARAIPPNSYSILYYHSLFKGKMPIHRDLNLIQQEPTGDQNILRGSPITTLSLCTPMCHGIWGLEKGETNPYEHAAGKNYTVKKERYVLEPGSVLIWHPRHDERFMHSLEFLSEVLRHNTKTFCRLSYAWIWAHEHGTYFTSGPNDGYAVPDETIVQDLNKIKNAETSPSWDYNMTVLNASDEHLAVESVRNHLFPEHQVIRTITKKVQKKRK
jgi:hypothetical protein